MRATVLAAEPSRMTSRLPGLLSLGFLGLLIGGAYAGLLAEIGRDWTGALDAFDGRMAQIVGFTLWQAALSTSLAILPAILVARALSRHPRFPGRALLLRVFAVPLGLPAIVAALGLLALYGRAGFVADAVAMAGGQWPGIYGLSGILIAHVFFNLPLATRLLLEALDAVPADQWRLASQLGMGPLSTFRLVEWPAMRRSLAGVAALVFMLCVTSFTLVLTLGGGPRATTLEVAIYQSLRFDFEPARAVALVAVQLALTVVAVGIMRSLGADAAGDASLPVSPRRASDATRVETAANVTVIGLAGLFVAAPMVAIVLSGRDADLVRLAGDQLVHRASSFAAGAVGAVPPERSAGTSSTVRSGAAGGGASATAGGAGPRTVSTCAGCR